MSAVIYQAINCLPIVCLLLSLIGDFLAFYIWPLILNAIFKFFLVVCLALIEFGQTPALVKNFSFMFSFLGRGVFYLILGFVTMGITILSVVGNFIIVAVGIVYIILHLGNKNGEPEFMSFTRYQRLTSGLSHDLPVANTYPVADQVPLEQQASPVVVHTDVEDKTEI